MNYYQRHIGDYIRDTSHLSLLEHGIYARLLDLYYLKEGPLSADGLVRLLGARSKDEKASADAVLNEFFTLKDGHWHHSRCDKEIEAARIAMEKARVSGRAGAAKRWHKGGDGDPIATPSDPHKGGDGGQVAPNLQPPTKELRAADAASGDDPESAALDPRKALWDLGVSVLGGSKARSLIGAACKRVGEPAVARVLADMAQKTRAEPLAYFVAATSEKPIKVVT